MLRADQRAASVCVPVANAPMTLSSPLGRTYSDQGCRVLLGMLTPYAAESFPPGREIQQDTGESVTRGGAYIGCLLCHHPWLNCFTRAQWQGPLTSKSSAKRHPS